MPSPPCDSLVRRSAWKNMSNSRGSTPAAMPMPVSRTRKTASPPSRSAVQPDLPAPLGVLGGVVEQVRDHLGQPHEVAVHPQRPGRQRHGQPVALGVDGRLRRLHGAGDDGGQLDRLAPQFDLAPR